MNKAKTKIVDTKNRIVIARVQWYWGLGEMDEGSQEYKIPVIISMSQRCNGDYCMGTINNNNVKHS